MIMIYANYTPLLHLTSNGRTFKPTKCLETKSEDDWKIEVECSKSYKEHIVQHNVIVAPTKEKGMQPFRIGNVTLTDDVYSFTVRHVFYDTKGYMLQDVYPQGQNGTQVMAWLFSHSTPFASLYTTTSDVEMIETARYVRKSLYDSLLEVRNTWGGHLDPDNYTVALRATIGSDRQVTIADAKNLEGIEIYENWDNVVTTIIPTCGDRVYSPIVSDVTYPTPYVRAISFESAYETESEIQADVIAQASAYMEKNKYPLSNYKVKSDILQNVAIGDIIRVKSVVLLTTNVILYTYDMLTSKVRSVEFGNYKVSVKSLFASYAKVADVKLKQAEVNQMMSDQTSMINSLYKFGYCVRTENETYYVDALPKENATYVRRDNLAGIGFSSSGINGPFTTAWTLDGKFNADFIKVGTLDVARINGSIIDITANKSVSDLTPTVNNIKTHFNFSLDGMEISIPGSEFSTLYAAAMIAFKQNGNVVQWMSAFKNYMTDLVITGTLSLPKHKFETMANGHTVVRYIGG